MLREYLKAVVEDDVFRIEGIRRNTQKLWLLLRSLARNESTTATDRTLQRDIKASDGQDISIDTVAAYLDIFRRLYLLDEQPAFSVELRSSIRVKQAAKRHFVDPSLAAALLGATPEKLLNNLETAGFLFEALCEQDLRFYAEAMGASLYHYQDYSGREMDAVIETSDGGWIGIEIKLGAGQIDAAARNLLKLKDLIATSGTGKAPLALCVVCGLANAAYLRPDGVYVLPITALKS